MTWMGVIYLKVGVARNLTFNYAANTGNGKTLFTTKVAKDATGNQATTGITISEIDATNNKGAYNVALNASTAFISATGKYNLQIYETADTTKEWEWDLLVTSDGTGTGTVGAASFTAVASNGRITDGSSALSGAAVRIRNSSNVIVTQFTSDSSGLWGPVYLDTGTYTIDAQMSGYAASTSKTITVSGSVATGPSTDVAVTATSSGTGLTNSTLTAYARRMIEDKVGTKADTEIQQAINDAIDMIAMERLWPYLLTHGELNLNASYATGTIALTNASTTCTLTTGTWPTWAASGKIFVNGKIYRISSRTSGSVVVLADAFGGTTATGLSYAIFQDEYSLPSDCMKFGRLLPGQNWAIRDVPVGFEQLLGAQMAQVYGSEYPELWAIYKSKIVFHPYPNSNRDLPFIYYRKPAALSAASDEADWDAMHVVLLRRAIDYQVSLRYQCVAGDTKACWGSYQAALARAVTNDKTTMHRPDPLGSGTRRGRDPLRVTPAS